MTRLGRGIRAVAQDAETASLMGVEHRPHHLPDLRHRRPARRRRRLPLRPELGRRLHDGLHPGSEGLHRRGARRDRQRPRRGARRTPPRRRREPRGRLHRRPRGATSSPSASSSWSCSSGRPACSVSDSADRHERAGADHGASVRRVLGLSATTAAPPGGVHPRHARAGAHDRPVGNDGAPTSGFTGSLLTRACSSSSASASPCGRSSTLAPPLRGSASGPRPSASRGRRAGSCRPRRARYGAVRGACWPRPSSTRPSSRASGRRCSSTRSASTCCWRVGLNVVVGYAGLLDLGYIAFYAIGAYSAAYWTGALPVHPPFHLNPFCAIPAAVLAAMLAGVLLGAPTLRLRGDYLAIVTLGFGEIIQIVATNLHGRHRRGRGRDRHPPLLGAPVRHPLPVGS